MKKGKDNNLDKDDMFEKSHLKLNTLNVQPLQCCYAAIFTDKKIFFCDILYVI
jgi:hypothetical protein